VLDRLIQFSMFQRVFVLVLTFALIGFGARALSTLKIEAFPDVQDVQVLVITQVPGQAPEEVERTVSLPIEREMAGVPRMTQLRSVSITGLSIVLCPPAGAGKTRQRQLADWGASSAGAADDCGW
jgi:heavy metal efflux system protein